MESPFESLLFVSLVGFSLFFLQIKYALKSRGYEVSFLHGWGKDYFRFKELIRQETDSRERRKLKGILLGLYASTLGMILAPVLGMIAGR